MFDPKALLEHMEINGLDTYGTTIAIEEVQAILGLEIPETGTRDTFQRLALLEMAGVDYARRALLRDGKYLAADRGVYRILLPSENAAQVERYMMAADRKLRRAQVLLRNTPSSGMDAREVDQADARTILKRNSIKNQRVYGRVEEVQQASGF